MTPRLLFMLVSATSVSACATYVPAPVEPAAIAQGYHIRKLDSATTQDVLARIAPEATWSGETWDRLSLFAAALTSNTTIAEARAHVASLDAAAKAAEVGPAMTLTLTAEYAGKATESSPWLYGVNSDIPLDFGTRKSSRIDTAQIAAIAARYDYAETVWAARMSINRALADGMLVDREIAVGEQLADVRTRQLSALEHRVQGGEAVRSDLERVRADAAGDARRLADAQARKAASEIALAEAIGISPSSLEGVAFAWENFDAPADGMSVSVDMKEAALLARADVLRAVAGYDFAEADLRGEVARQWPEVHIGPGYTWERGLVKVPFSLGLVLPPADFNSRAIAAAEARRAEAGVHLEAVIARADRAIDGALIERKASVAALAHIRDVELPTSRRIAAQADEELVNGAIDRVDWCAAQAGLLLAELAAVDSLRRVHAAEAALEDALRRPLDGNERLIAPKSVETP